jgi:heme exporter protein B
LLAAFLLTLRRELTIAYRHRIAYLNPLFFFLLITILFPFAITADPKKLILIGPGVIWIALLFANMLSIENLFDLDFEDGTLEQMALNASSFLSCIFAKLCIHWLTATFPLMITSLLMGKLFFLNLHTLKILFISLLLGSPVLTFLCGLGAALTLGLRQKGLILIILVIPLYLPVLIFGTGAVNDAAQHLPVDSHLYFLAAFLSLSFTFAPLAIGSALKISLEY